jgi:hypothetical protein
MLLHSEIPAPAVAESIAAPGLRTAGHREPGVGGRITSAASSETVTAKPIRRISLEHPDLELPTTVTEPVSDNEFYRAFRGRGVESLEHIARETLAGAGPDCERVALLRALYDLRSEESSRHFAWAIRNLPDTSSPRGESVPSFAVRFLGERAARDPRARTVLEQVAFDSWPAVAPGLRRRAAARLGATANETELSRLSIQLANEPDPLVVEGVLAALEQNPNKPVAVGILRDFGRPPRLED